MLWRTEFLFDLFSYFCTLLPVKNRIVITLFIIVITVFVSIAAFRNRQLMNQLIFYPPAVRQGQGYRLFTYGFLHADYMHLLFNMFTFYLFGSEIERVWQAILGKKVGSIAFIVLYASAIVISCTRSTRTRVTSSVILEAQRGMWIDGRHPCASHFGDRGRVSLSHPSPASSGAPLGASRQPPAR